MGIDGGPGTGGEEGVTRALEEAKESAIGAGTGSASMSTIETDGLVSTIRRVISTKVFGGGCIYPEVLASIHRDLEDPLQ
jgi:hypothetical protein